MGHAYYEFQHVELANVGSGKKRQPYAGLSDMLAGESSVSSESQAQPRARNPPGGPSSNIFAPEEATPSRTSSRPNKMVSSIPFGDTVDSPPSSNGSTPPPTPVKTADAIPLHAGDHTLATRPNRALDHTLATRPNRALADILAPVSRKAAPNPVTGQGYEPAEPAEPVKKPAQLPSTPRRRIPPGGYSSPLW